MIAAVTLQDAEERELSRWSCGQGPLTDELAAPIWGRYASFRGHPRIVGLLLWDLKTREVLSSGTRGETPFTEVLIARQLTRVALQWPSDTSRDTSPAEEKPAASSPGRLYVHASAAARRLPPTALTETRSGDGRLRAPRCR